MPGAAGASLLRGVPPSRRATFFIHTPVHIWTGFPHLHIMTCIEAKRAAMKRADGRCEGCGEELRRGHYHLHHVTYERKHHEDPDDLRVLCLSCHGEEHPHHDFVSPEEARRRGRAREGRRLSCRTRWPQGKKQIKGWRDGEWPVQCARCRMLVVHEKALRQHTKAVHPGEEPLSVQELESA